MAAAVGSSGLSNESTSSAAERAAAAASASPPAQGSPVPPPPASPPVLPVGVRGGHLKNLGPSKIVIRNTFIDVAVIPSTPSSPVTRSCPPSALIQPARPGPTLLQSLPTQKQDEAGTDSRRSPDAPKLSPDIAAAQRGTPTTVSPDSKPLEECWSSPLRPFDGGSALGGPQPPPWNSDLITELVANAAAMLEQHTPTLSNASPLPRPLEGLPLSTPTPPMATPPMAGAKPLRPAQMSSATAGASPTLPVLTPGLGAAGAPDAKAMACSFASISSFAAIDEGEEDLGAEGTSRSMGIGVDNWWRALEDQGMPTPEMTPPAAAELQPVVPVELLLQLPQPQPQPAPQQAQPPPEPQPQAQPQPQPQPRPQPSGKSAAAAAAGQDRQPLPSVGSKGHFRKNCKPCAFLYTKGCANGVNCEFCHLCEEGEKKRRVKEKMEKKRRHVNARKDKSVQVLPDDLQPTLPVGEIMGPPFGAQRDPAAPYIPLVPR